MQQEVIEKINRAEVIAVRCVMAVEFFDAVTEFDSDSEFWPFSQNCFGEMACLYWCHIFKSYSDEFHYKNLFDDASVSVLGSKFRYDNVRDRLQACINLTKEEYDVFRAEVVAVRNKYIAHKESTPTPLTFPRIDLVKTMFLELRDVFAELFNAAYQSDSDNFEYSKWRDYYQWETRRVILKRCADDLRKAGVVR